MPLRNRDVKPTESLRREIEERREGEDGRRRMRFEAAGGKTLNVAATESEHHPAFSSTDNMDGSMNVSE